MIPLVLLAVSAWFPQQSDRGAQALTPEETVSGVISESDTGFTFEASADGGPPESIRGDLYRLVVDAPGRYRIELRALGYAAELFRLGPNHEVLGRGAPADLDGVVQLEVEVGPDRRQCLILVGCGGRGTGPYVLSLDESRPEISADGFLNDLVFSLTTPEEIYEVDPYRESLIEGWWKGASEVLGYLERESSLTLRFEVNRAMRWWTQGRFADAEAALERILRSLASMGPEAVTEQLHVLNALAELNLYLGRPAVVRDHVERALALSQTKGVSPRWRVMTAGMLAKTLGDLGDVEAALRVMEQAIALAREAEAVPGPLTVSTLSSRAGLLGWAGRHSESLEARDELLPIVRRAYGDDHEVTHAVISDRCRALIHLGRIDEARPDLERCLDFYERWVGRNHPRTADILDDLCSIHLELGELDAARGLLEESVETRLAWYGELHPETIRAETNLAYACSMFGESERAWELMRRALSATERLLDDSLGLLSERERFSLARVHRKRLEQFLVLGRMLGEDRLARSYEAVLHWKGLVSRGLERDRRAVIGSGDREIEERVAELLEVRTALAGAALRGDRLEPERLTELRERRDRLERLLARPRTDDEAGSEEVRSRVPRGAALLDFLVCGMDGESEDEDLTDHLMVWISRGGRGDTAFLDLGPAAPLEEAVERYLGEVHDAGSRGTAWRGAPPPELGSGSFAAAADELRRLLWDPLEAQLGDCDTLFVSPDAFLGAFPFEVVVLADGRYLVEVVQVVYLSDATGLTAGPPKRPEAPAILVVGGVEYGPRPASLGGGEWEALTHTGQEAKSIDDLHRRTFGARSECLRLTGSAPSETRLVREMPGFDILHLATHSFYPSERGAGVGAESTTRGLAAGELPQARAGIVCATPGEDEVDRSGVDEFLTAEELSWLDLSSVDLVVLSSCSSAIGAHERGEGMLGLRRAFQQAGARTVISTLWPVHDAPTARLMELFYQRLWSDSSDPVGKARALREAQLEMLLYCRRQRFPKGQPGSWGAFVLQGDP